MGCSPENPSRAETESAFRRRSRLLFFYRGVTQPVRPLVGYVFALITREPLRREWPFEESDGNCRLRGSFAVRLSETAATWGRAVAPIAVWVARELRSTTKKAIRSHLPPTRLTQTHKCEAKGSSADLPTCALPQPMHVCRGCGASVKQNSDYCTACGLVIPTDKIWARSCTQCCTQASTQNCV